MTNTVTCPKCGEVDLENCEWEDCYNCEDGFSSHDCGEDTCCCMEPDKNVVCDICGGKGGWNVCYNCESKVRE